MRVKVKEGEVISATLRKDDGTTEKLSPTTSYLTIRQMLEQIFEILKEQEKGKMTVNVRYDLDLGYPTYLEYSRHGIFDGLGEIHIRDLELAGT